MLPLAAETFCFLLHRHLPAFSGTRWQCKTTSWWTAIFSLWLWRTWKNRFFILFYFARCSFPVNVKRELDDPTWPLGLIFKAVWSTLAQWVNITDGHHLQWGQLYNPNTALQSWLSESFVGSHCPLILVICSFREPHAVPLSQVCAVLCTVILFLLLLFRFFGNLSAFFPSNSLWCPSET